MALSLCSYMNFKILLSFKFLFDAQTNFFFLWPTVWYFKYWLRSRINDWLYYALFLIFSIYISHKKVANLRQRFFHSIAPGGLAGDRRGVVPASGFSFSAQQIWKVIKENKDLDLPAHKAKQNSDWELLIVMMQVDYLLICFIFIDLKVMVATVRCDEIAHESFSRFVANEVCLLMSKWCSCQDI